MVLGSSELTLHTGSDLFRTAAVLFYLCLVAAWITVALRTARGSLRGTLFLAPGQPSARDRVA
jgi:hypothetical protein